jgi:rhodanese-related sulfurtransferase/DNA-binding transcriptional ArsR family regulator
MAVSTLREQVYQELSRITNALSNPKRLELLDILSNRGWSVDELSREMSMSVASTSQHLQILKSAKLVNTKWQGNFIIYSIADDSVLRLVFAIKELGFRKYAEVEKMITDFRTDKNDLESITLDGLLERSKNENIMLIDVRPEEEYKAGHIPDAISIPISELQKRLIDLPKDKTIVAYCRGPLCVMSADAVKLLKRKKIKALRMEDGYVEWKLKQQKQTTLHTLNC